MTDESRQLRRQRAREQLKAGRLAMRDGLHPRPAAAIVLGITSVVKAKLDETANDKRAGEAAALAHELAMTSLRAFPARTEIACKRGCNYCCSSYVAALAPEIFLAAQAVRKLREPALSAPEIARRAAPLKGVGVTERLGRKLACPLLAGADCAIYEARPLVCRQATSLTLSSCIEEYESPDTTGHVAVSAAHITHASNSGMILRAALKANNLPSETYEFSEALTVALADPDSEKKWLAGEDVFRGVAQPEPNFTMDDIAARIARDLMA